MIDEYLDANGSDLYASAIGSAICLTAFSHRKLVLDMLARLNGTHLRYLLLSIGSNMFLSSDAINVRRLDVKIGLAVAFITMGNSLAVHAIRLLLPGEKRRVSGRCRKPKTQKWLSALPVDDCAPFVSLPNSAGPVDSLQGVRRQLNDQIRQRGRLTPGPKTDDDDVDTASESSSTFTGLSSDVDDTFEFHTSPTEDSSVDQTEIRSLWPGLSKVNAG